MTSTMVVRRSSGDALCASNDWKSHFNDDSPGPFTLVSRNLMALGSVTIERFLSSSSSDIDDITYNVEKFSPQPYSPFYTPNMLQVPLPLENKVQKPNPKMIARLHQTCHRIFGNTDALTYEFLEEAGSNSKQCILTITRPNGATRSYTTQPVFSRKNEAKAHVASIAINMGAIDFMVIGDSNALKGKNGLVLAPLGSVDRLADRAIVERPFADPSGEVDPSMKEIEDCCKHWRAGQVKPYWVTLDEPKVDKKHGAALRIELSPHSLRVYSSETAYDSIFEAKQACANIALQQGVLDYIKFGNGQTQPSVPDTSKEVIATEDSEESVISRVSAPSSANTLQGFYESLPQPFPEDFGNKSASEINAPAWLNTTIQAARGGKLSTHFVWITDGTLGLHGCLLRIGRPGESKSYLVDANFPKRADAKAAVCLQAMSQGVGNYIRGIAAAADNKITPSMRRVANQILPVLSSECHKVKPGFHPIYDFTKDRDAYGCTMKVELSAFPSSEDIREYTVPTEYRTKADAKIAVVLQATQQGLLELLRFRGEPPPPGYVASLAARSKDVVNEPRANKRKEPDRDDVQDGNNRKKRRKGSKSSSNHQGDVPFLKAKEPSAPRRTHALPNRPSDSHSASHNTHKRDSWKKLHASGSGGGSISGPAYSGRRTGPRHVGNFTTPRRGGPQGSHLSNSNGSHPPDGHLVYGGRQAASYNVAPHRPPSEPFHGNPYSPPNMHPNYYGIHGGAVGSAAHYPPSPYTGPNHDLMRNSGYVPPYGTVPVPYPSSHYAQSYQPAVLPSYHAQHPPAIYAVGPQPVVATGLTSRDYTTTSYVQTYYQIPAQCPSQQPSQETLKTVHDKLGHNAQALNTSDDPPVNKTASSEQEPGEIVGTRPPKFNKDRHQQNSLSSDRPALHGQKLQPGPSSTVRSEPSLTSYSSKGSARDSESQTELSGKPVTTALKSHVAALLDYCDKDGSPRPQFHNDIVTASSGETSHKVWVILGMERLELPVMFSSLDEGRERVAKQVLGRLRLQGKKGKGKTDGTRRQ